MNEGLEYEFLYDLISSKKYNDIEEIIVNFCEKRFQAQTIVVIILYQNAEPKHLTSWIANKKTSDNYLNNYAKIGFMLDPFYIISFGEQPLTTNLLRDIAPDRFEASPYYLRYYHATDLIDELGATLRMSENSALHFSLGRTRGAKKFRSADLRFFRKIAPLIMAKLRSFCADEAEALMMSDAPTLVERYSRISSGAGERLSHREAEVAALIVQGHSSRAAALKLGISDQTVKVHRRNIYGKLRISSLTELFSLLVNSTRGT